MQNRPRTRRCCGWPHGSKRVATGGQESCSSRSHRRKVGIGTIRSMGRATALLMFGAQYRALCWHVVPSQSRPCVLPNVSTDEFEGTRSRRTILATNHNFGGKKGTTLTPRPVSTFRGRDSERVSSAPCTSLAPSSIFRPRSWRERTSMASLASNRRSSAFDCAKNQTG